MKQDLKFEIKLAKALYEDLDPKLALKHLISAVELLEIELDKLKEKIKAQDGPKPIS